jgi:DNA-binding transcriptional MerR regulator
MTVVIGGKRHYLMLEVCRKARISRSTLLRWLAAGIIKEPIRDRRGWRIFSEADVEKIRTEIERTHKGDDKPQISQMTRR